MKTPPVLKRRREGVTDYRKRYRLVISRETRAVIRQTRKGLIIQLVDYVPEGDHVLVTVTNKTLKKALNIDGNNIQMYYLAGYMAAKKGISLGISGAVVDTGRAIFRKGGRIAAAIKGLIDGGLEINADEDIFPDESRLNGEHLKQRLDINEIKSKIGE
ncbi:50S ribosomal protein L18 [Picrophilus oshimae]|uniref:Large ribosomal subunit protein uL18 n=1 Tax=Picrophilus torridus (strain ATCC 700027 / DSM 9790 / JCM 10055 / NBRC 100828 / KAW 2/3) TaxID=1122961 RepID=RL18_PICTO|nr:50S ribosomal protein L18 [Picrophilus oshimae]Q6L1A8.1 RecName: Full=Large ribosomal subunit protein uL18; AltName: Full=50S ribosomal protein L18 [Picrophilus oshimae DSM 9789]AAT43244.1 large subunit ribosomal protein L18P [Picrophilus oshimae DSM 9789]